MQGQVDMMLALMRDLMNQAQMANNTFRMVKDYFSCVQLVRKCKTIAAPQASLKDVTLVGPVFENPIDKFYFQQVFNDEQRYGQVILNFLSNGIKFTPRGGTVSILLKVVKIANISKKVKPIAPSSESE
eukprot:CAMPEP_0170475156 /NCGR_PEP_ID=MMETSP0123-20130129/16859_1 /TAXON_ID=182087 /ORGANISM="Favella ehrenbergii, Strain Fehren 1" /LENGTH=128 /DNA_ID=CAMNT_0010745489 /DNA_START=300 /DNA_END=686 /DNA_ORIENTATION=+